MLKKLQKPKVLFAAFLCALAAASVFYAAREIWVFFTPSIKFIGGSMGLFIIMLLDAALLLALFGMRFYDVKRAYEKKWFKVSAVAAMLFALLFLIGVIVLFVLGGAQTAKVIWLYLKRGLPAFFLFLGAVLAILVTPKLKGKKRAILAVLLALGVTVPLFLWLFPLTPYKITSDPLVLDTGEDYCVVFATNAKGTGYVKYVKDDEVITVYAEKNGRIIGDRLIHSVHVPYEALKNGGYSVGSTRITEEYSYGSRQGKTVESETYFFTAPEGDGTEYLVLSDWHSYTKQALEAVSYIGNYDAVILMGDAAAGMDFEEEAAQYIVAFGGELTRGVKPAIYVRGNHDTRGGFADELPDYLGFDKLYYIVDIANTSFIVMDSGEDKNDDHIEYGGMDDYTNNRLQMLGWLQETQVKNEHVIALSHAWQISEPEQEISFAAWDRFRELGVRFVLSGHTHACRFIDGENDEEEVYLAQYPEIIAYTDGGHSGNTYVASKISVFKLNVRFTAVDRNGEVILEQTLAW